MRLDIDEHARGLLMHLGKNKDADAATYFDQHRIDSDDSFLIVRLLEQRGEVENQSSFDGADCTLNATGRVNSRKLLTEAPHRRANNLRQRMLIWLDQNEHASSWQSFSDEEDLAYEGVEFAREEVAREATYLRDSGLIKAFVAGNSMGEQIRPSITAEGRTCLTYHGGDLRSYFGELRSTGNTHHTTNITMKNSVGNIANASGHVEQNVESGVDVSKLAAFIEAVQQMLPVLGFNYAEENEISEQVNQLAIEAQENPPNTSKIRRMLSTLLAKIESSAQAAAASLLASLGNEVVKSITS